MENNELKSTRKEEIVAQFKVPTKNFLGSLRATKHDLSQGSHCPGWDLSQAQYLLDQSVFEWQ